VRYRWETKLVKWRAKSMRALEANHWEPAFGMHEYRTFADGTAIDVSAFYHPTSDVVVFRVDPAVEIWESGL
jgi:hypothetical protein